MLNATQTIARCLLRRHRAYADRYTLYWGMGWGAVLHQQTRAWYLWRMGCKHPNPQVRAVAFALHARL